MPTSYTSLLGLALPVQGELTGTWGDVVNTSITALLDSAVAGTTTLSTDADVTLTTTTGAANQARQVILNCTGARTAQRTIVAPSASKVYVVVNGTTGGYGVKIAGSGPTTGVVVPAGVATLVVWNGTDFQYVASTTVPSLTVSGNLTVNGTYTLGSNTALTNYINGRVDISANTGNRALYVNQANSTAECCLSLNTITTSYAAAFINNFSSTASTTTYGFLNTADATGSTFRGITNRAYVVASTACTDYLSFYAWNGSLGSGASITNMYGFYVSSGLTLGTNNYGFYSNLASAANRYNLYMVGTAANYFGGDMQFNKTVTAGGTTGAQTISKNAGTVNFAAGATSLVVTNTLVTTNSIIVATVGTNDTTMKSVAAVAASGSFTLFPNAAPTAETRVNFIVIN